MKRSYFIILFCSTLALPLLAGKQTRQPITTQRKRCCPNGECIQKTRTAPQSSTSQTNKQTKQSSAMMNTSAQTAKK